MTTVVLLAPIGLDAHCWDEISVHGRTVIRHELPGIGQRSRPSTPLDIDELADEIASLYEGDLDVVGASFGGMISEHLAIRHPERVRSLLLSCTHAAAAPSVVEARAEAVEIGGMEAVLASTLERWFTPNALAQVPTHPGVGYARATLLKCDPLAFADGWRAMIGHQVLDEIHRITARTTCVAGIHDVSAPVARSQEMVDRISGSRLVVLDGPHMLHLEHPAIFQRALDDHLAFVDDRS